MKTAIVAYPPTPPLAVLAMPETAEGQEAVLSDARTHALAMRVIAEIAAIETSIGQLRMQGGTDAENAISELQMSQGVLLSSLREVQSARKPEDLRQIASHVGVAIRQSTESRCSAGAAPESLALTAKHIAKTLAVPVVGSVAFAFKGKLMGAVDYRSALNMLTARGREFIDGFAKHIEAHANAASQHMVDIAHSQQTQGTLLQQAREAYVQGAPAEAATRITEAATLSLRDAERVKAVHSDAVTGALVDAAKQNATQAVRHAVDQAQVDARADCTTQKKTGQALEACTLDAATLKIEALRVRMIRIQVHVGAGEDEATERATQILRSAAPHDASQLVLGQARAQEQAKAASNVVRMEVTEVNMTQVRVTLEAADVKRPSHVMGPR